MSMKPFLLFVMLAGGTYGLFQVSDTDCDATLNTSLCSPALGRSVSIKLMNNATGYKLKCYKNIPNDRVGVFNLNKGVVTIGGPYEKRADFFIDTGTLKITNLMKNDTGQYTVTVHDAEGKHEKDISFILQVKETSFFYLILVCAAAGILLILAVCCCVWLRRRCCRKSGAKQITEQNAELQPSPDLISESMFISRKPY